MSTYLLDVNVLIAILDAQHVAHQRAKQWFEALGASQWLTSPTTQNGAIRILGNPKYSSDITPSRVIQSLHILTRRGTHRFIADSVSMLDPEIIAPDRLLSHSQITDSYLLALAAEHDASLATFDKRLVTSAVQSEQKRIYLIL